MRKLRSEVMLALLLICTLALSLRIQPTRSSPGTITVPDDYSTIQAAVNAASDGDTIFVRAGIYKESLLLNRTVALIGEDANSTCIECVTADVLSVTANSVNVSGFTVRGDNQIWFENGVPQVSGSFCNDLYLDHCGSCNITGNVFSNNLEGVYLSCSSNNTISHNVVRQNWGCAILVDWESMGNLIDGNVVCDLNQEGLFIESGNNTLSNNEVCQCRERGIAISGPSDILRNNIMANNSYNFDFSVDDAQTALTCDIDASNMVDGKPVYVVVNQNDIAVPQDAGYVAIVNSTDILIENMTISNSNEGIILLGSSDCTIRDVNVTNCEEGLMLYNSGNNTIVNMTITVYDKSSFGYEIFSEGIMLQDSPRNTFRSNSVNSNYTHFGLYGSSLPDFLQNIDTSNELSGKPIYYFVNQSNVEITPAVLSNPGFLGFVNSQNVSLRDLHGCCPALFAFSNNCALTNVTIPGPADACLALLHTFNMSVSDSEFQGATGFGIEVGSSNYTKIIGTNVTNCWRGMDLAGASFSVISENVISRCQMSLLFWGGSFNIIKGNTICNSTRHDVEALIMYHSVNSTLTENTISFNSMPLRVFQCINVIVYHNNFISNLKPITVHDSDVKWDDGYPSGGNYWSGYNGIDTCSGLYQNGIGSDGIGDAPYIIDSSNSDLFPFMEPNGWLNYPVSVQSNVTITGQQISCDAMKFTVSGQSGQVGYINATMPVGLNSTDISVFIDGKPVEQPFPVIITDGFHYFIYFEFSLSTHDITIQYAIPAATQTGGRGAGGLAYMK